MAGPHLPWPAARKSPTTYESWRARYPCGLRSTVVADLRHESGSCHNHQETQRGWDPPSPRSQGQTHIQPKGAHVTHGPATSIQRRPSTPKGAGSADSGTAPSIAPPAASKVAVPNGIGLNYQEAQDLWRAAGLHVAPANDATGANRLPVLDSNWVVVAQDLKPGSKVTADSFITATVKKYTDD